MHFSLGTDKHDNYFGSVMETIIINVLVLYGSFEHLFYGSTTNINILFPPVQGPYLYVYRRQILM